MSNPWLTITEADYVGHMSSPLVNQQAALNQILHTELDQVRPRTLLVLGCTTGNGLEHVDPGVTSRVVVVDINPVYLSRLVERFPSPPFQLEVRTADLNDASFEREAFDLIHAALVFEYIDWRWVWPRIAAAVSPGGSLTVVYQLASPAAPAVTPTEFTSLRSLETLFRFVDGGALVAAASAAGLAPLARRTEPLPGGKAFEVVRFVKPNAAPR
jgi:SAM-dependent methyltransferase